MSQSKNDETEDKTVVEWVASKLFPTADDQIERARRKLRRQDANAAAGNTLVWRTLKDEDEDDTSPASSKKPKAPLADDWRSNPYPRESFESPVSEDEVKQAEAALQNAPHAEQFRMLVALRWSSGSVSEDARSTLDTRIARLERELTATVDTSRVWAYAPKPVPRGDTAKADASGLIRHKGKLPRKELHKKAAGPGYYAVEAQLGLGNVDAIAAIARAHREEWPEILDLLEDYGRAGMAEQVTNRLGGAFTIAKPAQYPIILVHGVSFTAGDGRGAAGGIGMHPDISRLLGEDGHAVYEADLPPMGSIQYRGKVLAAQIDAVLEKTKAGKVNIIAHSMGGIDARYVVSTLGYGDRVASISMVGTPNHGSPVADMVQHVLPVDNNPTGPISANNMDHVGAGRSLTTGNVEQFNKMNPDRKGVYYQSWAGVSNYTGEVDGKMKSACENKFAHPLTGEGDTLSGITRYLRPLMGFSATSDGAVSVDSARWGNFRGCIEGDHLDLAGAGKERLASGFEFREFYRLMAADLATRGF